MDPLTALRDFTTRGEVDKISRGVSNSGVDEFRFGDEYHFPCTAETAYHAKQGGLYNLESLIFLVRNSQLKHTEYLQQARALKLQIVTLPDRKPLLDYLEGKVFSTDAIDPLVHREIALNTTSAVEEYRPEDPAIGVGGGFYGNKVQPDENQENDPNLRVSFYPAVKINNHIERIRALEKPLKDREALLECKSKNFQSVISLASKKDEERRRFELNLLTPSRGVKRPYEDKTLGLGFDDASSKQKDVLKMVQAKVNSSFGKGFGEGVPIIIVPQAFNTLLNIYNAKEFLEDGVYVSPDVKAKEMPGRPECVTIQKKVNRDKGVSTFEVRNKPGALSQEDWNRVAAVFVLGKEWQFRDWPFKDHVEIFNKLLGFYLRFEDDSIESAKTVRQWNVKIISLSKHKRHHDKAAALEIWDRLEEYMRARRTMTSFS